MKYNKSSQLAQRDVKSEDKMSLREDYENKVVYPRTDVNDWESDDYFDMVIKIEGVLTDDEYNEFEGEIRDILQKYKLQFSGV